MYKLQDLQSELEKELGPILKYLWHKDYYVTLVGGAVRDYFLFGKLSHDLDFEIRNTKNIHGHEWALELSHLFKDWPFQKKVEKLPYSIYRFSYQGYDLEFSSPRKETFISGRVDHKNFEVTLMGESSYIDSFCRRDFTINAIGVELKNSVALVIDPFEGVKDLEQKILRPISHDFIQDPVRFLRAIRFHFQLNLELGSELQQEMKLMDLSRITPYYIKTEMMKSPDAARFWSYFKKLCLEFNTPLATDLKNLFSLEVGEERILTLEEWVISCHLKKPLSKDQFKTLINYFQLSESKLKILLSFYDHIKILKLIDLKILRMKSEKEALHDPALLLLLELKELSHKLKGKDLHFGLSKVEIELLNSLELEHLRGQDEARKLMKSHKIPETYTSLIKLYVHLKLLPL
ncbi:MAG: hypothetical protein ACOYL6_13800 [Bacteriovoracaceae bacterium]